MKEGWQLMHIQWRSRAAPWTVVDPGGIVRRPFRALQVALRPPSHPPLAPIPCFGLAGSLARRVSCSNMRNAAAAIAANKALTCREASCRRRRALRYR